MSYRSTSVTAPEHVHQRDELFVTHVRSEAAGQFQSWLVVTMTVNGDAVRARFGAVFGTVLAWVVVRRAAREYTGSILIDPRQPMLVRERGFPSLNWLRLELPAAGAIVSQPFRAAIDWPGTTPREYTLHRLLAVGVSGSTVSVEAAVRQQMKASQVEVGARVWQGSDPPVVPGALVVFGGLGGLLAERIGTLVAGALRWPFVPLPPA